MKIRLDLKVPGVLAETEEGHIAESTWKARRAELINEPDDADAPEWAEWKAQKASGWWMYCESEPALIDGQWIVYGLHEDRNVGTLPAGHDWRDTLKRVERSTKTLSCDCGDEFPIDGYNAGFMAANDGVCANCDAAEASDDLPPAVFPLNSESHGIIHHDPQTVAEVQAWAEKHPEDAALELMLLRRKVEDATGENQRGGKCHVSEGEENV